MGAVAQTKGEPLQSAGTTDSVSGALSADLAAGDLRVALAPASGGRVAAFWAARDDGESSHILVPMAGPIGDPLQWPKAGCYPLAPFSNRIRNARFTFDGDEIFLPAHPSCAPHALHGFSQLRPWALDRTSERSAVMHYEHAPDAWPWPFRAEQRVSLAPDALTIELSVRNLGARAMPLGFGLHPYFAMQPGDRIAFSAGQEWRQDDAGCGTHARDLSDAEGRYDAPHAAVATTRYFGGWTRAARIARANGVVIEISAELPLDHFVFHVPAGGAYACMEPVSHVADAFNLASGGAKNTGFLALPPQGEIAARVTIAVRR